MSPVQSFLLSYVLNALWQAPLIFAAAWLIAHWVRRIGPVIEHRIWVAALMLEAILPACFFDPRSLLQLCQHAPAPMPVVDGITTIIGTGYVRGALLLRPTLLNAFAAAYVATVLFFAVRLAWRFRQTLHLGRSAQTITLSTTATRTWRRCAQQFSVHDARLATHAAIVGPITIGILHRAVLLPVGWLESLAPEDLAAALAHEFAHMQRRDFARNLCYELLALPVAWHPILWFTRSQLTESREILCDDLAAAAVDGKKNYAHSLLRLASRLSIATRPSTHHAIGIFDANNLERRVMNLTHNRLELRGIRRIATTTACIALGFAVCATALAMRLNVDKPQPATPAQPALSATPAQPAAPAIPAAPPLTVAPKPASALRFASPPAEPVAAVEPTPALSPEPATEPQADASPMHVNASVMSGNILTKATPVYPADARTAHVQGAVVLHAIIGKDGVVEKLNVLSGPKELMTSALDAVRQWTFRPYLLNGNPTEVETTITVNYNLGN